MDYIYILIYVPIYKIIYLKINLFFSEIDSKSLIIVIKKNLRPSFFCIAFFY